ncbi:ionotropic receptor 25a-like [Plutella xylostella]|uniref:ionotropic receptor 25a-like n=1 Tax=Plutella xylostella TaxID=51655 RepID=UPI002032A924|nr:ionotropic receptor 25a-like [Plutella xylostella]
MDNLVKLTRDRNWDPSVPFVVVVEHFKNNSLDGIFNSTLKYHIANIIVINATVLPFKVYTYDLYKNNKCGRKYEREIDLGSCEKLGPRINMVKSKISLRNCTINVCVTHAPPYSMTHVHGNKILKGVDQCMLDILADIEDFRMNYTLLEDIESFSTVNEDNQATGLLSSLQDNTYDIVLNGMVLIDSRARAFNYLYGHTAFYDDVRVFVPVAPFIQKWKKVVIEFESTVWLMLLITFIVYSLVTVYVINNKYSYDKFSVVLKLWDNIFLHAGTKINGDGSVSSILISWVIFTFLVNSYYTTSLMSLITTHGYEYQVQSMDDLVRYNYVPCISSQLQTYLKSTSSLPQQYFVNDTLCESFKSSLTITNNSVNRFTLVPYSYYVSKNNLFRDMEGRQTLFSFPKPLNKILSAVFLYKGFPNMDKLHLNTLRMKEGGHIEQCIFNSLNGSSRNMYLKTRYANPEMYTIVLKDFIIPYFVLFTGVIISTIIFCFEFLNFKLTRKSRKIM